MPHGNKFVVLLKEESVFEMSGTHYPVMQCHFAEERSPESHCHGNLKTGDLKFVT
jgi:hypothetical protein